MELGRKLDILVAEKVMGWVKGLRGKWADPKCPEALYGVGYTYDGMDHEIPEFCPSDDAKAAQEVLEKLRETCCCINIDLDNEAPQWTVTLVGPKFTRINAPTHSREVKVRSEYSMAHAICLAALAWVGVELEDA